MLTPWRLFVPVPFLLSTMSLGLLVSMGPMRMQLLSRCVDSLQDKDLVQKAFNTFVGTPDFASALENDMQRRQYQEEITRQGGP